jgi:hypothetical protein
VDEVGDALDEVDDSLAVVVTQVAGFEISLAIENLMN